MRWTFGYVVTRHAYKNALSRTYHAQPLDSLINNNKIYCDHDISHSLRLPTVLHMLLPSYFTSRKTESRECGSDDRLDAQFGRRAISLSKEASASMPLNSIRQGSRIEAYEPLIAGNHFQLRSQCLSRRQTQGTFRPYNKTISHSLCHPHRQRIEYQRSMPPPPPLGHIVYRTLQLSSRSLPAPAFYYRKKTINQRIKFQSRVEWSSRRLFFVKLNKVNNEGCVADIAYKIESNNPANSVTDCIALSIIELAELRAVRVRVRSIMSG